jgi:hypothetical protein
MSTYDESKSLIFFRRIVANWPQNTAIHQRARLLETMRTRSAVTTLEAIRFLDIIDPRARVSELRKQGYCIHTSWVIQRSESGGLHCVGSYNFLDSERDSASDSAACARLFRTGGQLVLAF